MKSGKLWIMLRTAHQRKTLCRTCPIARVADLLGDSCSILVLRDLLEKPRRFCDLQNSLSGISTRTLSNKLKRLEEESLVERKELSEPARVEYVLTKKGAALRGIVDAMRTYGKKYL
jgi:DNA-binding HxlR family transcriptional regulator